MIKDILNRDLVNLQNCESEPIHIPGSIQPHGFLIGLNSESFHIEFCSGNIHEFIQITHSTLLGRPAADLFGDAQHQILLDYISNKKMLSASPLGLTLSEVCFTATVHLAGTVYVVELEPAPQSEEAPTTIYEQTSQFLSYMHETHTLQQLCQLVAEGTRQLTGYDRVMIYRFDNDYNGEVFAESRNDEIEPFLGLHYPHTDIPVQARELYMRNLLRLISDVNYVPVPIYAIGNKDNNSLDLSLSVLRSSSPIHMQYLQNMGVGATLTISLLHQKRLWGLIACHHYSAKNIAPEVRLAAQLQGHFITSQIEVRQKNEEYEIARVTDAAVNRLNSDDLSPSRASLEMIANNPDLLRLCNASGVAIVFDGQVYKCGDAPSDKQIREVGNEANRKGDGFSTDKVMDYLTDIDCTEIAGVIFHPLGSGNFIIWFRPETVNEVHWGGDPGKAIIKDEKGLSPRNSFALWKELVKCQSKPWLQPELHSAANFAYSLRIRTNLILLTEKEKQNNELNQILTETNSELENINWISTHDLQEPLRKIQLHASRLLIQNENLPEKVVHDVMRMSNSAQRMRRLLTDILKYTKIPHTENEPEKLDPTPILREVISEIAEYAAEKATRIDVGALPKINAIPFLLKQLFSNLLNNAIKFSDVRRDMEITVRSAGVPQPLEGLPDAAPLFEVIVIADNGIGFEAQYEKSIFNIFKKLNGEAQSEGSGIGLALCKKIMKAHNGYISAKGKPGIGAEFRLYFPIDSANTAL
ncbi:MAG TPA: ATP-binding protein [Flavobacterium sp.]|jgi:light-regulated signal transduction histidine kinase (bacteriophytochrome)